MSMTEDDVTGAVHAWSGPGTRMTSTRFWPWKQVPRFWVPCIRRSGKRLQTGWAGGIFLGLDYYHLVLETCETSIAGDVGQACGVFAEQFQHKGGA